MMSVAKKEADFEHREICKLLSSFNSNKAQGPDSIHGKILKKLLCLLGFSSNIYFQDVLQFGVHTTGMEAC